MVTRAGVADELAWCAARLREGTARPRWRVWHYASTEIVLGCSQRTLLAPVAARAPAGVAVSVRSSGGGAVLAGQWMVGASIVLPNGHPLAGPTLAGSYRWLGETCVGLLREAGVDAHAIDPKRGEATAAAGDAPVRWACFGGLSAWEVVDAAERKIVGLAQQRRRGGIAYSLGLLASRCDWALLCDAMGEPQDAQRLAARTVACEDVPGARRLAPLEWAQRLEAELAAALGTDDEAN